MEMYGYEQYWVSLEINIKKNTQVLLSNFKRLKEFQAIYHNQLSLLLKILAWYTLGSFLPDKEKVHP